MFQQIERNMTTATTYDSKEFTAKGNKYCVTIVSGSINYIAVAKLTNNPYRTLGKQFDNFDKAQEHYKCPEMKTALLKIELGF